ncbi:hypothetical protein EVAR_78075_1 [Eumeta japonica]|uniref:Uncharacterized protein n=1 Tax=Eumeta variegata TaxID=151549 RepID=A0A4C1T3S9_EUMVA|nr:hypothetical protein EVAR_78075_1 [Eumeta japonica]
MYMRGKTAKSIRPYLQKAIDELVRWFQTWRIEVNPDKSAAIYFKISKVLHRDSELLTISKYMKDASQRFFSIAEMHPNPLLSAAVSYEAPPSNHFMHRPQNALTDPPDVLTAEDAPAPDHEIGPNPYSYPSDFLCRGDTLKESPIGQSRTVSTLVCCPAAYDKAQ